MPLLQTSGNVTADGYGGGVAAVPQYIEDVFSTYLYTGNGSTQTITNGIDLSGKGGLVWIKSRSNAKSNSLFDTARGAYKWLTSNGTNASTNFSPNSLTSFNSNGFSLLDDATSTYAVNGTNYTYASWTFRKQPKFFDVVTYTGTGSNTTIPHNLGSVPGCIIVKCTSAASQWSVYHQSLANTSYLVLNTTGTVQSGPTRWNSTTPTSTVFSVGTSAATNNSGDTYVAYLFASNAGGFGLTGSDNVISCGSFTTDASGNATVDLGYEPQYVMLKCSSGTQGWIIEDTMRGASYSATQGLFADTSGAEFSNTAVAIPTATGFVSQDGQLQTSQTYIYIAIRRGPMKVPTSGTSVFSPIAVTAATGTQRTTGFPVDMQIASNRSLSYGVTVDRLRGVESNDTGSSKTLTTVNTNAEATSTTATQYWGNTGYQDPAAWDAISVIYWNFGRAPSFFDEVCYTGSGSTPQSVAHNLTVTPEFIVTKRRDATGAWLVYTEATGLNKYLILNTTDPVGSATNYTAVSATAFNAPFVTSGGTFVSYLFATCAGVSKVGSYTGNGSTQTINCGFTGGARFVLIKRTDASGDWYVYDTARGMTTLTDPYLLLNSTAAESATLGSVTTVSTGFAVNASILAAINTNGASYIFLAVA